MISTVRRILLKHPKDAFIAQTKINDESKKLNYLSPPDLKLACDQYEDFLKLIHAFEPEVHFLPRSNDSSL